jgi:DNA-binding NtrC family response regulator
MPVEHCEDLLGTVPRSPEEAQLIGNHPNIVELRRLASKIGPKRIPVLVTGETGTGKEVLVTALHRQSGRTGPLKIINCGAIPHDLSTSLLFGHEKGSFTGADRRSLGIFEEAHQGTLFLDEIGELPISTQAVLLRALQTKRFTRIGSSAEIAVDVRIVAATHHDLETRVREGTFREDLLYRLNVVTLRLPKLRDRLGDLEPLAEHFLRAAAHEQEVPVPALTAQALQVLRAYDWPGNIRQLRNVVERAVALCDGSTIDAPAAKAALWSNGLHAPGIEPLREGPCSCGESPTKGLLTFKQRIRAHEIDIIRRALLQTNGNATAAARHLEIPIRTLTHKMRVYGLRECAD